jgi:hypothetical protein
MPVTNPVALTNWVDSYYHGWIDLNSGATQAMHHVLYCYWYFLHDKSIVKWRGGDG